MQNKGPEHKQAALDKLKKAVETGAKGDRKDTWLAMAQVHSPPQTLRRIGKYTNTHGLKDS